MGKLLGGHAVIRALKEEGVPFVVGLPGGSMFEIVAALADTPSVRPILVRHERVAADVADGYARVTGRPGVSASVQGPGAINAMSGISHSFADSVPTLHLAGQVDQKLIGRQVYQENKLIEMSQGITKWNTSVNRVDRIAEIFRRAFTQLRSGRPRPVLIELPMNVMMDSMDEEAFKYTPVSDTPKLRSRGEAAAIERAADLLVNAERPLIYAGAGVLFSEGSDELKQVAELLWAPVTTTLNGKSAFPEDHPLALGIGGFPQSQYGTKQAAFFTRNADVVLGLGNSFKPQATRGQGKPAGVKLIHVDVDPMEIHKEQFADVAIVGDAKLVLSDLLEVLKERIKKSRRGERSHVTAEIKKLRDEWMNDWMPVLTSNESPINPYRVVWEFMNLTDPAQTIVTHDSGSTRGYAAHHYVATAPRGFLGAGGQSNLGFSLGTAMGAKLAAPDKLVVNFMGDGAMGFTGMDIESAAREEIPILTILLNNGSYSSWIPYQKKFGDKEKVWMFFGGKYAEVAHALGAYSERVEDPREISSALERGIKETREGRPALIEVITERVVMPPVLPNPLEKPDGPWGLPTGLES